MTGLSAAFSGWLQQARWHAPALHLLEMLPVFAAGWLVMILASGQIGVSAWAGVPAVWAFFWGVKRTETRVATERTLGVTLSASNLGLFPWDWAAVSPWLVVDWLVPAIASAALAAFLSWWLA